MSKPIQKLVNVWRQYKVNHDMPLRLEFIVSDYCNLNCRGCTHYSPLAPKEFCRIDVLESSMSHLGTVCKDGIDAVYLIGGETLLYPQLVEAMYLLRKYFPNVKAHIFTNGLALPTMSDDFWSAAKELDFIISITQYPINFDYPAVFELCKAKNAAYEVFSDRNEENSFFRFALDPHKRQNPYLSHFRCYNRGCISVVDDKIYPCSISACVRHLNNACGTKFEHVDGDWKYVHDIRSCADILRLRDKPVPFCCYCIYPPTPVAHAPSQRTADEWVDN